MKTIEPVVFPLNLGTATLLNAYCINDNLNNSASFYYALLSDGQSQLSQGNLTMTGQDYTDWQTNQYAYDWIATQIDVTITGDYVPPTTTTTTTEAPVETTTTTEAPTTTTEAPTI
jgi:hypothetical protein